MPYPLRNVLLISGLLVSFALSVLADTVTWSSVMQVALNANDFDALLCSEAVRTAEWPAIYSSNTAAKLDTGTPGTAHTNSALYGLVLSFDQQLQFYAPTLQTMNDTNFTKRMNYLLEIRDKTRAGAGLINQLTADTLSRVLFVSLAERFGSQTQHTEWVYNDIANTLSNACQVNWIVDVFAVEGSWSTSKVAQTKALAPDDAVKQIAQEIGSSIKTVVSPFGIMQNVGLSSMMAQGQPSLILSLYRSLDTEAFLRSLKLADDYKRNATTFSLDDPAAAIDEVLPQAPSGYFYMLTPTGMTMTTNSSLDMTGWSVKERISRERYTGRDIESLFHAIANGHLEIVYLF